MENETKQNETRLSDLLIVLKKCWWLMLIVLVVASSAMYAYSKITYQPRYTATVQIWALKNVGTESGFQSTDVSVATYLVNDYKSLLTSDAVVDSVRQSNPAWKNMTVSQLRSRVSVTHEEDTRLLKLSVTAATKEGAKELADAWGNTFESYINDKKMNGEQMVDAEDALMPNAPSNSVSLVKAVLLGLVCAVLVYGGFFLHSILDDKINSTEDVERYLGLTVLGAIPNKNVTDIKGHGHRYFKGNRYYKRYSQSRAKK